MELIVTFDGMLQAGDRKFPCAIGRGGFRTDKSEGDGATPIGSFQLKRVFFRADRLPRPMTQLPVQEISPDDGWCDDPADPAYNTLVTLPIDASHEIMFRNDRLYDVVVEISHNDDPPIPGEGSAIFIHIAKPAYPPTEGCIALEKADLLTVLKMATPETIITIKPPEG